MSIKRSEKMAHKVKSQKALEIAKAKDEAQGIKPKFLKKGVGDFKPKNRV